MVIRHPYVLDVELVEVRVSVCEPKEDDSLRFMDRGTGLSDFRISFVVL